jgi:gamma-glutamyltranspeptidase / glutathione hydrolase
MVSLTFGVVEPHMSGIGGDRFYHVLEGRTGKRDGRTGRSTCCNGTGAAPLGATPERFAASAGGILVSGPLSISMPALLAGLAMMHQSIATRRWAVF